MITVPWSLITESLGHVQTLLDHIIGSFDINFPNFKVQIKETAANALTLQKNQMPKVI